MKRLADHYQKNGFHFRIVSRVNDVAIYSQHATIDGPALYFEVFIVQHNQERIMAGFTIPAKESCPGNEEWGRKGWTYTNFLDAKKKAEILRLREDRRKNATMQPQPGVVMAKGG